MSAFAVRRARPEDAAQIITHMKAIADEPDNGIALSSASEWTTTEEEQAKIIHDRENVDSALLLVGEADGQIIAYAYCTTGRLGYKHTFDLNITVNRYWRDKGVGSALLREMIDWCRANPNARRLELWVFPNNPRAMHVYEKMGFQLEGVRRKSYYKQGEMLDLILMGMLFER